MATLPTLVITKADLDASGKYIGSTDVSSYPGHIVIEENLGFVAFASIAAVGKIEAKAGSGIKAGEGIEAGSGIKAGSGIEAGSGIKAGEGIEAGSGIKAGWGIKAGSGIKAGLGIKAGWGIEAGWGIKAGLGIEAGWGIKAGWGIECKLKLAFRYRLFAGVNVWAAKEDEVKYVRCGKLEGPGVICYGDLEETGLPEEAEANAAGPNAEVSEGG